MFIKTIAPDAATGTLKEIYDRDLEANGYLPHHVRALSLKPEVLLAWRRLITAIREGMDPRRYVLHAYRITPDWEELRAHGFSDAEILDIALTSAARAYSKTQDALGAGPDEAYLAPDPRLREALTVGRPFGESTGHGR